MSGAGALREAAGLVVAATIAAGLQASFLGLPPKPPPPPGEMIEVAEVAAWPEPPFWIDARSAAEYEAGHAPDALLLNEDNWVEALPELLRRWRPPRPIVVYCSSRECGSSREIARRLREAGLRPVHVLAGGWDAWQSR